MIEPDAVDPHEIQAVTHHPKDRGLLATRHQPASAAVRPLAMGAWFLNGRDDKRAVTTDCHAGIYGSRTAVSGHLAQQRGTMRFRIP